MGIGDEWQYEYEQSRYLRELPDVALQARFDALIDNLWSTDAAGNVTPPRDAGNRRMLLRLVLHTMLEQIKRTGIAFRDLKEHELRLTASSSYTPPKLRTPFTGSPSCFAKFGSRTHIRDALERGILRISPASLYNDASLNKAQMDAELEHYNVTPNEHLMFRLFGLNTDGKEIEAPVQHSELFRYMMVSNFYVWCCAYSYDARLFGEFKADAVLVIRDRDAFGARIANAVELKLPTGEKIEGPITYYDPYTTHFDQLIPIFSKNFKFLYQNEYRFAWKMPLEAKLAPFFIELGPLKDIAEVIEIF